MYINQINIHIFVKTGKSHVKGHSHGNQALKKTAYQKKIKPCNALLTNGKTPLQAFLRALCYFQ